MLATVAEYSSCAVCEDSAVQVLVKGFGNLIPQAPILMLEPCLPLELEVIPRMEDYLVEGRDFRGTSPVVLELPFRFTGGGRYGPYVTDGTTNASLPQGAEPEALTMEQAVELMDARAAKGPSKGRRRAAKPKAAKAAAPKKAKAAPKKKASKKATPDAAA